MGDLKSRILVLDGATGTAIQKETLTAADFGGEELEGCNENLVLTRPDIIKKIHLSYLAAGADIVETNTFGSTPLVMDEYGLGHKAEEISRKASEIAREACREFDSRERIRYVAASIGPTTKAISVTGGIDFDSLSDHFYIQARGLYEGGADYFLIETCQDAINIKAALIAIDRLHAEVEVPLPVAVSITIEPMGTMLAGQGVEALATALDYRNLLYVGLNCATGPEFMTDHIRSLAEIAPWPVACLPNAGLPDVDGRYLETPAMMGKVLERFIEKGWVNLIGGCCGTTDEHIREFRRVADAGKPRIANPPRLSRLSGIDYLEVTEEKRPVLVGERTNIIGSKKFKEMIVAEKWDEASDIARAQVKGGAHIIDVCLANPDRDELADIKRFLPFVVKKTKAPIMIDSTDAKVIHESLKLIQGKAIINSINLEDGEERFEEVLPLAREFGAAVVVGCIDDDPQQGMGVTRERKLEIAEREFDLLTKKYGIRAEDIYWDALVFPCGTGDQQYVGSAPETIAAVKLLKEKFPGTRTVLGISNVSFGLPPSGREVLNSVFLYHCVQNGLDLAIVNTEKLQRYASLTPEEIDICDRLLWNKGDDPVAEFTAFFRSRKPKAKVDKAQLNLDERLANYIIEGSKDGLVDDLDRKRAEGTPPLEIINGPLMKGMDTVGKLFNSNQLIVAEVLQSAEAMKAAVAHLQQFMTKGDSSLRGKVLLATVKGDVHDIGKNLVEIILSNNGFEVLNLGIKVPSEQLIAAVKEHRPDILGLSGLLVKSAQQMEISAGDLATAGIDVPILVGGAALSQVFTDRRIAKAYGDGFVTYAKDAMNGLDLAKKIVDQGEYVRLREDVIARQTEEQRAFAAASAQPEATPAPKRRSAAIRVLDEYPRAPDFQRHLIREAPLDQIWNFVNNTMLYTRHLGIPGAVVKAFDRREMNEVKSHPAGKKFLEVREVVEELKSEFRRIAKPASVHQFFKAASEGNTLHILPEDAKDLSAAPLASIEFPRMNKGDELCISDYAVPVDLVKRHGLDTIALFCTTAGKGIRERSEAFKLKGEYLNSHAIAALALETAEAYAEYLHGAIRTQWGFPDPPETTMMERFQAKYRGCRYSFGYPACPRLDDQEILFRLLKPEDIGVELTEGFMMDPEASVSAIVFHHPDAKYFSVGQV
jgi:5-methyltetrahydrofolate--homocysteine methyltransferase